MKTDPRYHGRHIESSDGTSLFVEEIGDPSQPSILWIHGYCQNRLSWNRQFEDEQLVSRFHQVRLDLRGHGRSDKPTDPQAYRESKNWAGDIHAVINSLQLRQPVLAGWSYGGYVICDYIRHYGQDKLGGLIFVAAATEMGRDEANAMLGAEFLQLIPGFFSNDYVEGSAALQHLIDLVFYEELDADMFYFLLGCSAVTLPASRRGMFTRRIDNRALLQSITLPSLIVQGKEDRVILPVYADHITQHVPQAVRASYEACGHAPFADKAVQFNNDVAAFLTRIFS